MANYDNLPVFKATYDLLLKVFHLGQHMQRDLRYTLGENLKKDILALLTLIYQANATHDKEPYIEQARVSMVAIKLQIRLMYDLKQISIKTYASTSEMAESISKQLAAWAKTRKSSSATT